MSKEVILCCSSTKKRQNGKNKHLERQEATLCLTFSRLRNQGLEMVFQGPADLHLNLVDFKRCDSF